MKELRNHKLADTSETEVENRFESL